MKLVLTLKATIGDPLAIPTILIPLICHGESYHEVFLLSNPYTNSKNFQATVAFMAKIFIVAFCEEKHK